MSENPLRREFVETALLVILRVMRRKKWLEPADLTELRVALAHNRAPEGLRGKLGRVLAETLLEGEERRETPRKPG